MIQAIVTDLDDTLLRRDKTLSERTIHALRHCRAKGIKVILATGRGMSAKALIPFELFDSHILMNGAQAAIGGAAVYERVIRPEVFRPFLQRMSGLGICAAAEINGVHFANFAVSSKWTRDYVLTDFKDLSESAEKLYAVVDSAAKAGHVRASLPAGLYAHFTKDDLALITHHEATKHRALAAVLDAWSIPFADAVAFGDDSNDKEMLERCGIGVAMGNALAEIKETADGICGDCDSDGVAGWIFAHIA